MCQNLPIGKLEFIEGEEKQRVVREFMHNYGRSFEPNTDEVGYFIEADLFFPPHLADYFASYPPLAEKRRIAEDELSPHSHALAQTYGMSTRNSSVKLITDLTPKFSYKLHYRYLIFVLSLGVELKAIKRVIRFQQRPWLKSYIEGNTKMRNKARSESERNLYKAMNNTIYGKALQNIR